ncbi:MAG: nucleoside hydrolase [Oscillospiraceae bacterium]|jgi:inosine-uridine nucleoside N-ribohydrolase
MDRRKVIFDVDTGSDDAIAMMLGMLHPEKMEILGLCSVNGNRGIDYTTENTLRVVDWMNSRIPVYRGCELPYASTLSPWRRPRIPYGGKNGCASGQSSIHGDYLDLPAAVSKPQKESAVIWLVETLMASPDKITLIPVGPLTNIAHALRIEPRIKDKIEEVVIMGGAYHVGNVTAVSEFNWWIDPEAAKIVMDSGLSITLIPLDATHSAYVKGSELREMCACGTRAAQMMEKLVSGRIKGYSAWQPMEEEDAAPIHDALCTAYVLDPSVIDDMRDVWVDVDFSGGPCDGMSVCDVEKRHPDKKPNCRLALHADREKFVRILADSLKLSD